MAPVEKFSDGREEGPAMPELPEDKEPLLSLRGCERPASFQTFPGSSLPDGIKPTDYIRCLIVHIR